MRALCARPLVGQGRHGVVMEIDDTRVAKIVPYFDTYVGSRDSPFHPVNAEYIITSLLQRYPHVVRLHKTYTLSGSPSFLETKADQSRVMVLGKASCGSVIDYLCEVKPPCAPDDFFKTVVFQVAFTLECIYQQYPYFRHNDLSIANVLLDTSATEGTTAYTWPDGHRAFSIKNIGVSARIADFDSACICGLTDNYKTLELNMLFRGMNFGYKKDHRYDIFRFVYGLYSFMKSKLSKALCETLRTLFGPILDTHLEKNLYSVSETESAELPTVTRVLLFQGLFDSCKVHATKSPPVEPDSPRYNNREVRRVPRIQPKDVYRNLSAEAYFESLIFQRSLPFTTQKSACTHESVRELLDRLVVDPPDRVVHQTFSHVSMFLDKNYVPSCLVDALIVLGFVAVHRRYGMFESGHEYESINGLIELAGLKMDEEQFMQTALQWSWFWRE